MAWAKSPSTPDEICQTKPSALASVGHQRIAAAGNAQDERWHQLSIGIGWHQFTN